MALSAMILLTCMITIQVLLFLDDSEILYCKKNTLRLLELVDHWHAYAHNVVNKSYCLSPLHKLLPCRVGA